MLLRTISTTLRQVVKFVFASIEVPDGEPEENTGDTGNNTHRPIVPHQVRIIRERYRLRQLFYPLTIRKERDAQTKASPSAEDTAEANKNMDMTSERMFLGALVNAYSNPVIEARISLIAMRI